MDSTDGGEFNETSAAKTGHSMSSYVIEKHVTDAVPLKYKLPVAIGFV